MRSPQALHAPLLLMALAGTCLVLLQQHLAGREVDAGLVTRIGLVGWVLVAAVTRIVWAAATIAEWTGRGRGAATTPVSGRLPTGEVSGDRS